MDSVLVTTRGQHGAHSSPTPSSSAQPSVPASVPVVVAPSASAGRSRGSPFSLLDELNGLCVKVPLFELLRASRQFKDVVAQELSHITFPPEGGATQVASADARSPDVACPGSSISFSFPAPPASSSLSGSAPALYVEIDVGKSRFKRALIDEGAGLNVASFDALRKMGYNKCDLSPCRTTCLGFDRTERVPLGAIRLPVTCGPKCVEVEFVVLDVVGGLTYNFLLGRPWIHSMQGVSSSLFRQFKFLHGGAVVTVQADPDPFAFAGQVFDPPNVPSVFSSSEVPGPPPSTSGPAQPSRPCSRPFVSCPVLVSPPSLVGDVTSSHGDGASTLPQPVASSASTLPCAESALPSPPPASQSVIEATRLTDHGLDVDSAPAEVPGVGSTESPHHNPFNEPGAVLSQLLEARQLDFTPVGPGEYRLGSLFNEDLVLAPSQSGSVLQVDGPPLSPRCRSSPRSSSSPRCASSSSSPCTPPAPRPPSLSGHPSSSTTPFTEPASHAPQLESPSDDSSFFFSSPRA